MGIKHVLEERSQKIKNFKKFIFFEKKLNFFLKKILFKKICFSLLEA